MKNIFKSQTFFFAFQKYFLNYVTFHDIKKHNREMVNENTLKIINLYLYNEHTSLLEIKKPIYPTREK